MAQRVGRGIALLFHYRGTRRDEWSAARPGRTSGPGKTRYPFYSRLGGPQGQSGRTEKLIPTGILSRTIQPVAQSLYRLSYPAHLKGFYFHLLQLGRRNALHIHRLFPILFCKLCHISDNSTIKVYVLH